MPMPSAARGVRVGDRDRLALPADLALVGVQHAVDDLDQRRLAGAVLAEQRVDLARHAPRSSTRSLATTPGKRLVMPRSSRRGGGRAHRACLGHAASPPSFWAPCVVRRGERMQELGRRERRDHRRPLVARAAPPIGQTSRASSAVAEAELAQAALEARPLGARADQAEIGEVAAPQHRLADLEVERVAVGQDEIGARPPAPPRPRPAAGRSTHDLGARRAAGSENSSRAAVDPAHAGTAAAPAPRASARPTWPAPNSSTCGSRCRAARLAAPRARRRRPRRRARSSSVDVAAAALADRGPERQLERAAPPRRSPACARALRDRLPLQPAAADRADRWPRAVTSIAAPASRGVEPLAAATCTSTTGSPRGEQLRAATAASEVMRAASAARALPSSLDARSAPAPASPAGRAAGRADSPPMLAIASESACSTEIASISGGSPTALERKIVASRFSRPPSRRMLKTRGRSRAGRDLVGAGRVGPQPPLLVPPQLLGGQPAHALDEAALDLADVDRRVQRLADIVQDVDALDLVLAGQRVDRDLAAPPRHRRSRRTAGRGRSRGPSGSWASCRSRSRTARRAPM